MIAIQEEVELINQQELLQMLKHSSVYNTPCPEWVYGVIRNMKVFTMIKTKLCTEKDNINNTIEIEED
jgi:hypothetical protein